MLCKLVQLQRKMLKTNYCRKMTFWVIFSRYSKYILQVWWTKAKTLVSNFLWIPRTKKY